VAHLLRTKLQLLTPGFLKAIDLSRYLPYENLILSLVTENKSGVDGKRFETIGAFGDLLLRVRREQRNQLRLEFGRVDNAAPEGIRNGKGLRGQAGSVEI
jgi:hypothetical protein